MKAGPFESLWNIITSPWQTQSSKPESAEGEEKCVAAFYTLSSNYGAQRIYKTLEKLYGGKVRYVALRNFEELNPHLHNDEYNFVLYSGSSGRVTNISCDVLPQFYTKPGLFFRASPETQKLIILYDYSLHSLENYQPDKPLIEQLETGRKRMEKNNLSILRHCSPRGKSNYFENNNLKDVICVICDPRTKISYFSQDALERLAEFIPGTRPDALEKVKCEEQLAREAAIQVTQKEIKEGQKGTQAPSLCFAQKNAEQSIPTPFLTKESNYEYSLNTSSGLKI